MFESDGKKLLQGKGKLNNKMAGIGALTGKNLKAGSFQQNPNTVYGELKLSEQLQQELSAVRDNVNFLNEQLEQVMYERDCLTTKTNEMQRQVIKVKRELANERRTIMEIKEDVHQKELICDQMVHASQAMTSFVKISENYRKKFSDRLR